MWRVGSTATYCAAHELGRYRSTADVVSSHIDAAGLIGTRRKKKRPQA